MWHYAQGLPDVEYLREGYNPPQSSRIYAADGTLLFTDFLQRRTVVPFRDIPDVTKLAFLAAEDAHFYEHPGVRLHSLVRALWVDLRAGKKVQGGSTITQEVAEDVLLGHSRAFSQKIQEWILAFRLERQLGKDVILSLYLNNICFGHGRYGIEEAARYYLGKHAAELDAADSALLAGILPSPERYSPRRSPELALARRTYVLAQMRDKGFLSSAYYDRVVHAPLVLAPVVEDQRSLAPEAVRQARRALEQARDGQKVQGGYAVETSIDPQLQTAARQAVRDTLDEYADRHGLRPPYTSSKVKAWGPPYRGAPGRNRIGVGVVTASDDARGVLSVQFGDVLGEVNLAQEERYNRQHLAASEFARPGAALRVRLLDEASAQRPAMLQLELGPQAALAAVDVRSHRVLALVGSYEGVSGGFDRGTQAHRQPGSAFKPIVYAAALRERKVSPSTVLELGRRGPGITAEEPPYRITVRSALAHSNNDAAVAILRLAGPEQVVELAHQLGISSPLGADDSLALGSYEVTPLELANAYAAFASGGLAQAPLVVSTLSRASTQKIELPLRAEPQRVLDPGEAYLVTSLLESVVEDGTAEQAKHLGRPIAAKTGTTNLVKDAWLAGYSTDVSVAVWVGYDDALPLGAQESGASVAGPAFVEFMRAAHEGRPATEFPRPENILTVSVDPQTGLLPWLGESSAVREDFLDGMAPEQFAAAPPALGSSGPAPSASHITFLWRSPPRDLPIW